MKLHSFFESLRELRTFLLLFTTQALSSLGSAMTSYALVIWAYQQSGSALSTALLTVSSYAPYVVFSLFCGALVDRLDTRRTMLVSDALAACTTVAALVLLQTGRLQITHLYLLNALNGLMNTLQQPASEAATTALLPKSQYQRVGGLRYLSSSLSGLLTPVLAMALMMLAVCARSCSRIWRHSPSRSWRCCASSVFRSGKLAVRTSPSLIRPGRGCGSSAKRPGC